MAGIRVFTYNLRIDVPFDGINSFSNRRDFIRRSLPGFEADILGFQEAGPHMRRWLMETFPQYQICGVGREADLQGESNPIAFRRDKFDLVDMGFFWLSDTPQKPGSRFSTDQSGCPRVCTCATLVQIETGRLLRFYNTHLDHEGAVAQAQGLTLILARMAEDYARWPAPVILTGDFNAFLDSLVHKSAEGFCGCGQPIKDVTASTGGTFHGFGSLDPSEHQKIDYIFTNMQVKSPAFLVKDQENGLYLSDHYPVGVELEL